MMGLVVATAGRGQQLVGRQGERLALRCAHATWRRAARRDWADIGRKNCRPAAWIYPPVAA